MIFPTFLAVAILIIAFVVWKEATLSSWKLISERFAVPWESHNWADNVPIYVWSNGDTNRTWLNGLHVAPSTDGLRLYPPWFKHWYFKSVEIPWSALKVCDHTPQELRGKLVLEISILCVFIAIPSKYRESVRRSISTDVTQSTE